MAGNWVWLPSHMDTVLHQRSANKSEVKASGKKWEQTTTKKNGEGSTGGEGVIVVL